MSKRSKPYWEMNKEELAAATRKYDEPFVALNESRPLTPAQRRMLQRAKRRGRPRVGQGAKRVLVTIERGLLKDMDNLAKRLGKSRSQLIAEGV
ncbi:MAG TPA: hypothetical protein VH370_12960, partial [Humisphaera sp.]|nr:hypothetical protein [Humisphaera sp.]